MPFAGEAADQLAHVAHPRRVEAGRGLVEDQQARAAQQRRGDPQALAHPVRVAADPVLARAASARRSRAPRRCARARRRRPARPAARGSCARSGTGRSAAPRRIRRRPRARARPWRSGSRPNSSTVPSVGMIRPERHAQRRGLAGAVGPEEAVHVAGAHVQVDVVDRQDLLVALDQPARPDGRRARRPPTLDEASRDRPRDRLDAAGVTAPTSR